jgi:hypothetical protein
VGGWGGAGWRGVWTVSVGGGAGGGGGLEIGNRVQGRGGLKWEMGMGMAVGGMEYEVEVRCWSEGFASLFSMHRARVCLRGSQEDGVACGGEGWGEMN